MRRALASRGVTKRRRAATPYSWVHLTDMLIYLVFMLLIRTKSYPLTHGKTVTRGLSGRCWSSTGGYG